MNRHLFRPLVGPSGPIVLGTTVSFWGSGRGSHKWHTGTVVAVIDPSEGTVLDDFDWLINEYKKSALAFNRGIVGRNGTARHYLVDVGGTLYRPNLSSLFLTTDTSEQ